MACVVHPYQISCLCAGASTTVPEIVLGTSGGIHDLATSEYPELTEMSPTSVADDQAMPYGLHKTTTPIAMPGISADFRAPVADMTPGLKRRTTTKNLYANTPYIVTASQHDYYSERFALSPTDIPTLHAGPYYSDKHALSPIQEYYTLGKKLGPKIGRKRKASVIEIEASETEAVSPRTISPRPKRKYVRKIQATPDVQDTETEDEAGNPQDEARRMIENIQKASEIAIKAIMDTFTDKAAPRESVPLGSKSRRKELSDEAVFSSHSSRKRTKVASVIVDSDDHSEDVFVPEPTRSRKRKQNRREEEESEAEAPPRKTRRTARSVKPVDYAE